MNKLLQTLILLSTILQAQSPLQTRTQMLMGTFVDITLPIDKSPEMQRSFEIVRGVEMVLSSYAKSAYIYRLNRDKYVKSHIILRDALGKSIEYYHLTNGYFDITIGSITKSIYHFGEDKEIDESLSMKSANLNINEIYINDNNISIGSGIVLDLGGMGKGYGVDEVVSFLKERNITRGKVALSGDIYCIDRCEIYIQSPLYDGVFAKVQTSLPHTSISTSGTYRRYIKDKSKHHLIDPKKRIHSKSFISVSLFSIGDNSRLDAFTTAISVMPKDKALEFLDNYREI